MLGDTTFTPLSRPRSGGIGSHCMFCVSKAYIAWYLSPSGLGGGGYFAVHGWTMCVVLLLELI